MVKEIIEMPTKKLYSFLHDIVDSHYDEVYSDGDNYIFAVGDNPLCLVAHIDTVSRKKISVLEHNGIMMNQHIDVLGADDRAGVYGLVHIILNSAEKPSIIFTNYEERGGLGVAQLCRAIPEQKFQAEISMFLELDRQGCNEYVYYSDMLPSEVKEYVESFGFQKEMGIYSDIQDLTIHTGIPSVNLSIGYYGQHSSWERLVVDEMYLTINRVLRMLKSPIKEQHLIPEEMTGGWGHYIQGYGYGNYGTNAEVNSAKEMDNNSYDTVIGALIRDSTMGGKCISCGVRWEDCCCGNMYSEFVKGLFEWEIDRLIDYHLCDRDQLYDIMVQHMKDWEAAH